ncbi:superoxide dismutase [Phaeosphaeriaceae sp. PMI808]|nr:superoxide dismutase [Phaeosphaeriaceae sp. PMI808]
MRTSVLSVLAVASAVSAQSSTVIPAPMVSGSLPGAGYIATLPIKEGNPLRGSILGVSAPDGVGVKFSVSFSGLPATGGPFIYHIHEKPVPADGNCTGTGAHLDPYKRGEVPICDASKPETCQTGDLSGKFGNITTQQWSQEYIDTYSSTRPDSKAFFGNLSFVLHLSNKTRIGCANFTIPGATLPSGGSSLALPSPTAPYNAGNGTATIKPTGVVPMTPSSSKPAQFTGAAAKVAGGTGALLVAAAALVL